MGLNKLAFTVALGMLTVVSAAWAVTPDIDAESLEIQRPHQPITMAPDHARAAATASLAADELGGQWSVYSWNPALNTPRWIIGSGTGRASSSPAVATDDVALMAQSREFVESQPTFFRLGNTDLVEKDVVRGLGKVAVHFDQTFHGIPVVGAFATLVYHEQTGRMYAFGSELYADIDVSPVPVVSANEALSIAKNAVPFDPAVDEVFGEPELLIVPIEGEFEVRYHLAWRVRVSTQEPYGIWVTHVDAHSGRIVWRYNDVHQLYEGSVVGDVEIVSYCDGTTPNTPLANLRVVVANVGTANTDSLGAFTISGDAGSQDVTAELRGSNFRMVNAAGPDAAFAGTIQPNTPFEINFDDSNSTPAGRDVYYWLEYTKRFIQNLDGGWNYLFSTANVNVADVCNANWSSSAGLGNFFEEGGGCANTGRIASVVAHEFGHGIQGSLLTPFGYQGEEGLGEGNGDITSTYIVDDPVIGRGFFLNNCTSGLFGRNCQNTLIYPDNLTGQIHQDGRIICGFNWDVRQALEASLGAALGEGVSAELWHYGRKLLRPTVQPDQVLSYFIVDDDDGDLTNLTPHFDDICTGASNHGFACVVDGVLIQHTPLEDTNNTTDPYQVTATILSVEGALVADSLRVFYRTNFSPFQSEQLLPTGGSNEFEAFIPAQQLGTVVQYYILGRDAANNRSTLPEAAPGALYTFIIGGTTPLVTEDMEADNGWTVGPNTAAAGIWERVDPIRVTTFVGGLEVAVTPGEDVTPDPGINAWITEQEVPGQLAGAHDVDDGITRLLSPVYDLSGETYARLEFYLWYSNEYGNNALEDAFEVEVSSNGGLTWADALVRLEPTGSEWEKVNVEITNFVSLTDQMRFRFVAQDNQSGDFGPSLVEAGVDEFALVVPGGGPTAVSEPAGVAPPRFALDQNQPNPFNPSTNIRFALAVDSRVTLGVYDVTGKLVRTLLDEPRAAGVYSLSWDGTDRNGTQVSSGIYFYRLDAGDFTRTRKMVLLK